MQPLILQYYQLLPESRTEDESEDWARSFRKALAKFRRSVEARYLESTLERLLFSQNSDVRQAAVLALGLNGSYQVNEAVACCLHDEDLTVRQMAAEALWSIWQRADTAENVAELQRLVRLVQADKDPVEIQAGFDALIRKAPRYAEAFNQRAIFHFQYGDYAKSVADCDKALRLNPYHFGAANGMGQCFMKQKKLRAALRSFRRALRINPNLENVRESIQSLERMLGEEGKK